MKSDRWTVFTAMIADEIWSDEQCRLFRTATQVAGTGYRYLTPDEKRILEIVEDWYECKLAQQLAG